MFHSNNMHQEGVEAMSKDELQFISDLTEKHQINFTQFLVLIGIGATRSAYMHNINGDFEHERKMLDIETDLARAVGVIPLSELLEGSEDLE